MFNTMNQYTVHIPTHDNDGNKISLRDIQGVLNFTLKAFGGYTYDATAVQGAWVDPKTDKQYVEGMTRLTVATQYSKLVQSLAEYIKRQFDQECVYVVKQGTVEFV